MMWIAVMAEAFVLVVLTDVPFGPTPKYWLNTQDDYAASG